MQRESDISVNVLMQAVEVVRLVMEEQRSGSHLTVLLTFRQKYGMFQRKRVGHAHRLVPFVRKGREMRITTFPQLLNDCREWIVEVLVVSTPETIAGHNDVAAKVGVVRIKSDEFPAFLRREQGRSQGTSSIPQ